VGAAYRHFGQTSDHRSIAVFNATSSVLSIVNAIFGAAVGAILILLILNMTGDRSNRKCFPAVGVLAAPMATAGHARPATVDKPSARTRE
jgi:hypothetical protein